MNAAVETAIVYTYHHVQVDIFKPSLPAITKKPARIGAGNDIRR